jgi:hypothetical protein
MTVYGYSVVGAKLGPDGGGLGKRCTNISKEKRVREKTWEKGGRISKIVIGGRIIAIFTSYRMQMKM